MKIALYHNLTSGGSKREAYEFARQFVRDGHTVDLYCSSIADERFLPLDGIVHRQHIFDLVLVPGLAIRFPGLRRYADLLGLAANLRRLHRLAQQVAAQIDAEAYDFVLAHHDRIVQTPYLFRYLKTRALYYCNEPMREFYDPPIPRPYQQPRTFIDRVQWKWYALARSIERAVIQNEDRQNIQRAPQLLTNSFFAAESIYRAYDVRASVSYLGVDTDKFKPLDLERQNAVLSVGAVSPLKGYDFLIRAIGLLPIDARPRLVIVGNTVSTGEVAFLRKLAEENQVALEIHVDIPEDELVRWYNQARALVYTSVLEPFGFAPLEAMACETPVVAVREGGVRESVVDGVTGLLTQRDPCAFAAALERILRDEKLAAAFGKQGRVEVLRFWTWEHAYARLMEHLPTPQRANTCS